MARLMPPAIIRDALGELVQKLGRSIADAAAAAVGLRGRFLLVVPGGSVARHLFPALAKCRIDWRRAHLFWTDERFVPPVHPESNYGLARRLWLDRVPIPKAQIHPVPTEGIRLDAAAAAYEKTLAAELGRPPAADFVLLGVGPDGHVASLFPGRKALSETARWATSLRDAPKPPARRVTLTLPALLAARQIAVLAAGSAKARVVRSALDDKSCRLPLALLIRRHPRVALYFDETGPP